MIAATLERVLRDALHQAVISVPVAVVAALTIGWASERLVRRLG